MTLNTASEVILANLHKRGIVTADEIAVSMGVTVGFVRRMIAIGGLVEVNQSTLPAALRLPQPLLKQSVAEKWWDQVKHAHWAHRKQIIEQFSVRQRRRREYLNLSDIARYYAGHGDAKLNLKDWRLLMLDAVENLQFEGADRPPLLLDHQRPNVKITDVDLKRWLSEWPDGLNSAWVHRSGYEVWARRNGYRPNDQWISSRQVAHASQLLTEQRGKVATAIVAIRAVFPNGVQAGLAAKTRNRKINAKIVDLGADAVSDRTITRALKEFFIKS